MCRARAIGWLAAVLVAVILLGGCTTSSSSISVPVKNDQPRTVVLVGCASKDCRKRVHPETLRPGQIGQVKVDVHGGYTPAIVLSTDGTPYGCLPFRFSTRAAPSMVVPASAAVPCGTTGGVASAHGQDWPDPHR